MIPFIITTCNNVSEIKQGLSKNALFVIVFDGAVVTAYLPFDLGESAKFVIFLLIAQFLKTKLIIISKTE